MPLDKQNTARGTLDMRFTPEEFDNIRTMASVYDATNPDLSEFQARGGKLILWHGYSDPSIVPTGTLDYYSAVVKQMGGLDATQNFARLFMLPGVYHCGGGYGPSHFDMVTAITAWVEYGIAPDKIMALQYSSDAEQQFGAPTGRSEPNNNGTTSSSSAMPQATGNQSDVAPMSGNQTTGQILSAGGNPYNASGTVIRTLPAYPYPMVPKFTGKGDVNEDNSYMPVQSNTTSQDDITWLGQDLFGPPS
jgi:Tannase and feruloyl esterase